MERTKEYNPFFSLCCVILASLCQPRTRVQVPQEPELLLSPLHSPSAGTCSFFRSYGYYPDLSVVLLIELGMNVVSSHRNHENRSYEGSPPQGPSRGTAGLCVFQISVVDPPRGRPVGGGGTYQNRGYGGLKAPLSCCERIQCSQRNPSYNSDAFFGLRRRRCGIAELR